MSETKEYHTTEKSSLKVTFLHHSSFLVEMEHTVLLFDYFAGNRVNGFTFTGTIPQIDPNKDFYVFASHKHHDHFDMDNLKLAAQFPKIHFIFSKDCKMSRKFILKHGFPASVIDKILYVAPEKEYEVGDVKIRTLTSTDEGVAFCVEVQGQHIYHAGDLNWWHWEGVGDLVNGKMERMFKREMRKITNIHFKLAFVPLDTRQQADAFKGFGYFMQHIDADHVFPMHMWQDYSLIQAYKRRTDNDYFLSRIEDITKENEEFLFS